MPDVHQHTGYRVAIKSYNGKNHVQPYAVVEFIVRRIISYILPNKVSIKVIRTFRLFRRKPADWLTFISCRQSSFAFFPGAKNLRSRNPRKHRAQADGTQTLY